jgi:methyl acetate hydrolase
MMATNQIGELSAGKLKTARPDISSDVDFHPGFKDGFGFGFLINSKPRTKAGVRPAAWPGAAWRTPIFGSIRAKDVAGVIMMQFLPFADKEAVAVLGDFERAVYASVRSQRYQPMRSRSAVMCAT